VPSARSAARSPSPFAVSPLLSHLLSQSEFPALTAQPPQPSTTTTSAPPPELDGEEEDKDAKRAAKRAAAAVRAAERQGAKEMKERERAERKAEREREAERKREEERLRTEREEKERAERERKDREVRAKGEREKEERLAREKVRAEKAIKDAQVKEAAKAEAARKKSAQAAARASPSVTKNAPAPITGSSTSALGPKAQGPLLSKMPKKNKPATKPIRIPKEDESIPDTNSAAASAVNADVPSLSAMRSGASTADSTSLKSSSRGQSVERDQALESPTPVAELLAQIQDSHPEIDLARHVFFDTSRLNPASRMPLEYGPLVHALSALSVGGGSFASSMPPGSIDHAVSSFQQLLETLTQTISDLLRLLPRTTWDDSSSFDGVLRDMLKGDDFLDLDNPDAAAAAAAHVAPPLTTLLPPTVPTLATVTATGTGKDEVAALTQALERRARWMEVQLSKLEELHRDINTAAVRAVLAFNDGGWDPHGFAPRSGNTLQRFDALGLVDDGRGGLRQMSADELEKKLAVAREVAVFAEAEVREMMEKMQGLRPAGDF
jgi:CCR4-NOT transcription complex subunit 4